MKNAWKLVFFFEILMKFCRNFTNMLRMSRIFNFLKKKDQIFRKIRENFGNVQIIQKIIQNYSGVSLAEVRASSPALEVSAWLTHRLVFKDRTEDVSLAFCSVLGQAMAAWLGTRLNNFE